MTKSIKDLNEELNKLQEEYKVLEKQTTSEGDEIIFKVNKDSQWTKLYFALREVSPKRIEEAKLIIEKDGQYLIEGRSSVFRDLLLFLYDGEKAKRVSPKQALEFLTGGKAETIFRSSVDLELAHDEEGNIINNPDGSRHRIKTHEITFEK